MLDEKSANAVTISEGERSWTRVRKGGCQKIIEPRERGRNVVITETIDFAAGGFPGQAYHARLDELRDQGPVVAVDFGGEPAWLVTRHAELAAAFRDTERFPPGAAYRWHTEPTVGRSFISMDEPEHRIYRKLATPTFRPTAVARAERDPLVSLAHELIDDAARSGEVDLVRQFAELFPMRIICRMLGIPRDAEQDFRRWAIGLLSFPFDPQTAARCAAEFSAYVSPLIRQRRRSPRDDVVSQLVEAKVEGRGLEDEEILSHIRLLFPTGAETTSRAIANLLFALLAHEGAWKRVVEDPTERGKAIEELLRWENPVAIVPRVSADVPIEYGGVEIPPRAPVLFCVAAANRDPRAHRDPHRFDPTRPSGLLLSFGPGPRQCPGMHLARKELAVALDVLCERAPGLRLLDPDASLPVGTVLRGPERLPVELA